MTADDLMRRLAAKGHDVPLQPSPAATEPQGAPPARPTPRSRDVVLFGAPDRDSTAEIAIHRANGWIAIMPAALGRMIAGQPGAAADELAAVLGEALRDPDWHAVFAPLLTDAFGHSFRLFSRIEGAVTLHFDTVAEVCDFVRDYLAEELNAI